MYLWKTCGEPGDSVDSVGTSCDRPLRTRLRGRLGDPSVDCSDRGLGSGRGDLDSDLELHISMQTGRNRMGADSLDGLVEMQVFPIELDAGLRHGATVYSVTSDTHRHSPSR